MRFCKNCGQLRLRGRRNCACNAKRDVIALSSGFRKGVQSSRAVSQGGMAYTAEPCEQCGMRTVTVHVAQTRAADESPTRFYRCATCEHARVQYG